MKSPIALTIGSYDGIHLGHQKIITELKECSSDSSCVLTFENHPRTILAPDDKPMQIQTIGQKLEALDHFGINAVILIAFDNNLRNMPFQAFLEELRKYLPFDHLVLGEGARFGRDQQGTMEAVSEVAQLMGFEVHYVEKAYDADGNMISSGHIRQLIQEGKKQEAKKLLNHPFSCLG